MDNVLPQKTSCSLCDVTLTSPISVVAFDLSLSLKYPIVMLFDESLPFWGI